MNRLFATILISGALTATAFAALKTNDKAPDFSTKASLAGKEFAFGSKALDLQRKDRTRPM